MSRSLEIMGEACTGLTMITKRMFGGHGFFAPNGAMFAGIVTDDEIVVKLAPGDARDELIALGGHPWTYDGQNKPMTMQAWIVIPDSFYDDIDTLHTWLRRAYVLVPPKPPPRKKSAAKTEAATTKQSSPVKPPGAPVKKRASKTTSPSKTSGKTSISKVVGKKRAAPKSSKGMGQ